MTRDGIGALPSAQPLPHVGSWPARATAL